MTDAYEKLEQRFRRQALIGEALAVLSWDTATMMPSGGGDARAEQQATLAVMSHETLVAPEVGEWLAAAETPADRWRAANLHEMRRAHAHATAVPADLVAASSRAASDCELAWREARAANDFAGLLPKLQEVLNLTIQAGQAKAAAFGVSLYDALLDQYEPGGSSAEIDRLFGAVQEFLPELIGRVLEHQASQPAPLPLEGPFPIEAQKALGERFMGRLGFDFSHGRLDVSHHPFCGGVPGDIRITTRYSDDDFSRALMGVLHETGHALYEAGLPKEWRYQPVGYARGMAMHESQSLLMEMQACRSHAFARYAAPAAAEAFGKSGPAWTADNLYRLNTVVRRGLIRVDADEVTYPAHVILRYRLERALLGGDLALKDLPGEWRAGMLELVGVAPEDDRDGCLQDIHWPGGAWGYFPTYTLGAMIAAQLFDAARSKLPSLDDDIARGDFSALLGWLRIEVHGRASSLSTSQIVEAATGRALDPAIFRRHLERRYLSS